MNNLIQLIKQTGLSYSQLSLKLNKNKKYISWVLANGVSSERQAELIEEIKTIIAGEVLKTDAEVIAELSSKLAEAQDNNTALRIAYHNYLEQWKHEKKLKTEANELNAGLINTNTKLNTELNATRAQLEISEQANKALQYELEHAHKTAQNDAHRILELNGMVDTIDTENDELRATIGKQRVLGFIALITTIILAAILIADSKFLFWM